MVDNSMKTAKFRYEVVPGFFIQDNHLKTIEALPPRFGLLDDSTVRWKLFQEKLHELNETSGEDVSYKAFILGRHGQGVHNVAEAKYGTDAWNTHWAKLSTDGELIWGPDPELTELGVEQATAVKALWEEELALGLPKPRKLFCSPLTRAVHTNLFTFKEILDNDTIPMILENCREHNGRHTCDKRRSLSYLIERFPGFAVEDGFSEEDEAWDPVDRETDEQIEYRARMVLDKIFEEENEAFISVTSHGGFIRCFCKVVRHVPYALPTGGIIAMVLRAVKIQ